MFAEKLLVDVVASLSTRKVNTSRCRWDFLLVFLYFKVFRSFFLCHERRLNEGESNGGEESRQTQTHAKTTTMENDFFLATMRWWAALFLANLIVEVNSCYLFTSASTTSTHHRPLLCVFLPSQTFNGDFSSKILSLSAVGAVHCAQQKNRRRKKGVEIKTRLWVFCGGWRDLGVKKKMVKNLKLSIFLFFSCCGILAGAPSAIKGTMMRRK